MELGEGIKKILLAGIGTAAVTAEKSKEVLDELVKKGEPLAQLVLAEAKLPEGEPKLVLNVPSGTNFYDIDINDFKMINYNPVVHEPKLEFELAI